MRSSDRHGISTERKIAARSLLGKLEPAATEAVTTFPDDRYAKSDPEGILPGVAFGRVIGLALTQGGKRNGGHEELNPFDALRGIGEAYGEWMRGENYLSVAVTREYFETGLSVGMSDLIDVDVSPGPEGDAAEKTLTARAVHALTTTGERLIHTAEVDGLDKDQAARVMVRAALTLAAIMAPHAVWDRGALQYQLDDALQRAAVTS